MLVEELLPIAREFYTSMLLDRSTGDYLAMMTAEGGMDIEELARTRPEALRRVHVDAMLGLRAFHVRELVGALPTDAREGASDVLRRMYALLQERDATLVEVNPLVQLEDGSVLALDSKVTIDDNALFRHPDVEAYKAAFPIDPVQARANEKGLQYVKLDGNVGIIGNGAGLVMSTLDVVRRRARGRELPRRRRRRERRPDGDLARGRALRPRRRRSCSSTSSGASRCDLVAQGVLGALDRVEATVPLVIRLDGTNADEGRALIADAAHPASCRPRRCSRPPAGAALANGPRNGQAA